MKPLGGVPALLPPKTFCSNGAWVKCGGPVQVGWVGQASPLSGPGGLLAIRRGQCQQEELREEGGEKAIWGEGAST